MDKNKVVVECLSQGVKRRVMTIEEADKWFAEEEAFWAALLPLDNSLTIGGRSYAPNLLSHYSQHIANVRSSLRNQKTDAANKFISAAQELRAVLGHGSLGKTIQRLTQGGETAIAQRIAMVFSVFVSRLGPDLQSELASLTAVLHYNPYLGATKDVVTASAALATAERSEARIRELEMAIEADREGAKSELSSFVAATKTELTELHQMYESYLVLQGPSRHWKNVSRSAFRYAAASLGVFVLMLAVPFLWVWLNWNGIASYIDHILDVTKGSLSIASIVLFTVPVLAYGWLLKHISRIFTQNLTINADAEHRRVLAITFLGLAKRKAVGISEQDRALILNALFRPSPTGPHDDGPPAGLLELIRK